MGAEAVLDPTTYDFSIGPDGDILTADQLDTALFMSLFCERRAASAEVPKPELRRGWIGNEGTGFEIGSKLWLYEQARLTRTTLNGIATEASAAVQWLVDDGIAERAETEVTLVNSSPQLTVTLYRSNSEVVTTYFKLWEGTGRGA